MTITIITMRKIVPRLYRGVTIILSVTISSEHCICRPQQTACLKIMASTVTSRMLRLPRTVHPFVRSASHYTSSNIDLKNLYDIVIIGGGIAGTALACALAHSPISRKRRVALIEAQDLSSVTNWRPEEAEYSNRVSSLTPASYRFFKGMF